MFKESDADAIQAQIGGVAAVAPEGRASVTVVGNGRNWTTSVTGSTNRWFTIGNWRLASGRMFSDDEQTAGGAACIIGETVRREIFGGTRGLGEQLRIKQFSCEVIGVLASKGQAAMGNDQDDVVVVPLHTLQRRVTGNQRIGTLLVSMEDGTDPERLKASLGQLLRERRKLAAAEDDNFNVLDTQQLAETLSGTTKVMTTLLGAVAAVSLLVGGIGIMNIMLVSVTERTREIGLRLAIGALEREVLLQFLIEAVTLAAMGGIVGIVIATVASFALAGVIGCHSCSTRESISCPSSFRRGSASCSAIFRHGARLSSIRSRRCGTSNAPMWHNPRGSCGKTSAHERTKTIHCAWPARRRHAPLRRGSGGLRTDPGIAAARREARG